MKWIFFLLMMISLNLRAETALPEILVSESAEFATDSTKETVKESPKVVVQESEIPVQLESAKKSAASENPLLKILLSLGVFGVLGCAGYFFIKKYMKSGIAKGSVNQVKVLSQHYLGPKKSLAIIRVAGESILIGITDHNISLIKELSLLDEEIPETTPKNFGSVLHHFKGAEPTGTDDGLDEFSISGIKDFVSTKLKNMRTLE